MLRTVAERFSLKVFTVFVSKANRSITAAIIALAAAFVASIAAADPVHHWVETFGLSPASYILAEDAPAQLQNAAVPKEVPGTIRFAFKISAGGEAVRLRFSNEAGSKPLLIDAATVAIGDGNTEAVTGDLKVITFSGKASIVAPAGAPVVSDPVSLATKAFDTLVVNVFTAGGAQFIPLGGAHMELASGDQTASRKLQGSTSLVGRPLVSGVAVAATQMLPVIVALGDSITDGVRTSIKELHGYPEQLARRFASAKQGPAFAVVNAGISGNRMLSNSFGESALARFDRDVLRIPNVSHLILLEGINDIGSSGKGLMGSGPPVTAADLIASYRQVITRAHSRGIKVFGGTLLPFAGAFYYSPEKEQVRVAANQWIRTSGEFDGVIDFEAAIRDPVDPQKMRSEYDSGDHLHPNEAGYRAMGDCIDLDLFR